MRKWIILLFVLLCAVGYSQQVPIRVIRADTTNGLILMTKDSVLRFYSTDSLPGVSPQDLSMVVDSIKITDGDGIPLSQFAAFFQAYVLANEGKAYDIVEKILSIGGGLTISFTNPGSDTGNHDIEISAVDQSASNEFQTIDQFDIVANQLGLSLENDGVPASSVDLSPYLDNTDDQNLSFDPKSGSDVTLNIQDGVDVTLREGANVTLTRSASNLLEISATGDGTGTDDQNISGSSFAIGTGDLTIGIENGTGEVVNLDGRYLQTEVDGSTSNELQDFDIAQLTGTNLELSLTQDATTWTVDLSSLAGGSGIDTLVNYDALRAYVGTSKVVYVQDFNVTYLGDVYKTYGGLFVNGSVGENGATIIDGWQRVFDGVNYLADWYEMNGYDDSGVDNAILIENDRINAIIRVANANGGGVVHLTPGEKRIDDAGVYSGSNRYSIRLLSNIALIGHGTTLKLDTNLIDGTFTLDLLHSVSDTNVIVKNLTIEGNTADQSWNTYEQTGKTFGIRLHATTANPSINFHFENININDVFGNSIFTKGNDTDYDVSFRNLDFVNINCVEYGEGPVFEQVQNLRLKDLSVDPNAVAVGDHLEFVRCQDYEVDGYVCHGGSGSGSGIDVFGAKNGVHTNFIIRNVANAIEVHKDNNGNHSSNLRFDHGSISDPLQATVNGIVLETGNGSATDIHFSNITLDSFYNGVMINDSEGVPGPVSFTDVIIRNCTQSGYQLQTVKDVSIVGGEVYGCNDHGIYWNSQLNETAITGEANLNVVGVKIFNNDNDGVRIDMSKASKTYSLKANIDVDAFDNGDDNVWANQGSSDTNRIYFVNSENVLAPTTSFNNYAVYGITDMYPNANLQRMFGVDGQKIRVHGKNGGIQLQNGLLDHTMIFLDSASNVTIDSLEWIEFQYSFIEKRWFETDRRNKTEIVDVHGKFVPNTEWPGLTVDRVIYWSGTDFTDDADFTFDGSNLGVTRVDLADSLNFYNLTTWAGGMYRSGWDIIRKSAAAGGFHLWYNHSNQLMFHLYNADRSARFYGDVEFDAGVKDVNNSTGLSGQILSSTGSATDWITGDLTDDQTLSFSNPNLTISGGNTVDLSALSGGGGGSGTVKGTGVIDRVAYWAGTDSLTSDIDFTFNGTNLDVPTVDLKDSLNFYNLTTWAGGIYRSGWDIMRKSAAAGGYHLWYDHNNSLMFHLWNSTGDGRFYNNLGVGLNPSYKLDVSGDARISGHLGLDGKNPNGSYSIYAGGHAIFEGTGNSYTYIKNDGYIQYRKSGQYSQHYIDGSDFLFKHLTQNTMRFESDNDVRVYDDLYVDGRFSVNTTPSGYNLRVRTEGSDYTTSGVYIDDSGGSKLLEVRNDGALEGEVQNWVSPLVGKVTPNSYGYGEHVADPSINNAFFRATDRFTVTATNTSNSNFFYWFDDNYTIGGCDVNANDTAVISIDLTAKGALGASGLTYTQGRIVIVTHAGHDLSVNSYGRFQDNAAVWTNLTYNGQIFDESATTNFTGEFQLYEFVIPTDNNMTDIELSLVNDNAFALRVRAIMWFPFRPSGQLDATSFQKYNDQNMTRALIFRDDQYDQQLIIDPQATDVMTATGSIRVNDIIRDGDGDGGNVNQIIGKSRNDVNKMDYRDFHDYFTLCKLYNSSSSVNLNQVAWTAIDDIDTKDFEYGDSTFFDLVSGDLRVYSQGVINLKGVLQLTSLDTAAIDLSFFEDGNKIGKTYTVHFAGAQTCTVNMDETLKLNAFDDIDIRARRRGSATGSVTITATESAYLQAELKKRGH